jgi:CHAT domain-containing protein
MCIGNPNLDAIAKHENEQGNMTPRPLPYADVEAQQIAALFNTNPITGLHATKIPILANLEKVSILHIASHGASNFGSIFLSPDFNFPFSDLGAQQAYQLREFDLLLVETSARLVFLSCCCTARGAVLKEGLFGIARAFLDAGARCVIVTLWPINDSVTSEFAHRFYTKLFHEKSACEALQLTMNEFQVDRDPVYQLFTSWAPFQVLGEDVRFTKEEIKEIRRQGDAKVSYFDHYDK